MGILVFDLVPMSGRGRDEVKLSVIFGTRSDEVKSKVAFYLGRGRDEVDFHAQLLRNSRDEVGRGQLSVISQNLPLPSRMNQCQQNRHLPVDKVEAT